MSTDADATLERVAHGPERRPPEQRDPAERVDRDPDAGVGQGAASDAPLIERAAANHGLTPPEEDALLAYFLGSAPAPNATTQKTYAVDLADGREWVCTLRSIDWAEWQDAQKRALNASTGQLDLYEQASYVVARGMVRPMLGRMIERIREATSETGGDMSTVPTDGASMLRRSFARQAGSLIYLQRKVLELSRLDEAGEGGVKEVEAAKNS